MPSSILRCAVLLATVAAALRPSPSRAVVIDDCHVGPYSATGSISNVVQSGLDSAHVVGGQRAFSFGEFDQPQNSLTFDTTSHQMIFASGATNRGYLDLKYGATTPLGVDLTAQNNDRFRFTFPQNPANSAFLISFSVTSAESANSFSVNMSSAMQALAGTGGIPEIPFLKTLNNVNQLYLSIGRLPPGSSIALDSVVTAAAPTPGDYNRDGDVNQADYQEWRRLAGKSVTGSAILSADGNGDGRVDTVDYVVWRKHVGSVGAQSGAFGEVPEDATIHFLLVAGCVMMAARQPRRSAI